MGSTLDSGYSIAEIIENGCKNDILGYLGKSCWSADPNFTGTVSKFAVYNGAKSAEEIQEPYAESFQKEFESLLTLDDVLGRNASADEVYFDLNFEDEVDEMTVSWKSSDESVIAADGTVSNTTDEDKEVTVTASVTEGNLTASQTFDFTVKALDKTELNELLSEAADLLDIAVKLNDSLTALKEAVETAEAASTRSEIAAQVKSLSAAIAAAEADADYLDPFAKVDDSAYSESLELKVGESAEIINISDDVADYLTLDLVSADEEIAKLTESNGKVSVEALNTGTTELIITVTSVYDAYPVQYLTEIKVTDESGDESSDNGNTGTDESDGNSDNGNSGTDESSESSDNGSSGTDESNEGGSDNGNAGADESDGNGSDETGSNTTVTPATPAGNILSDSAVNVLLPKTKYYIRPGFKVKKYVISNKKTVKVSKKGKVTIKKSGTATITAVGNNGQSVVYTIDAEIPKMKALTVTKAGNYNISEMLSGLTYAKVDSYASSKTSVAEISDNGTITVKAKGSTRITVVIDGKKYRAILKAKI